MRSFILLLFGFFLLVGSANAVELGTKQYEYVADNDRSIIIDLTIEPHNVDGYLDIYRDGVKIYTAKCPAGRKTITIPLLTFETGDHPVEFRYYTTDPTQYTSKFILLKVKAHGKQIPEFPSVALPVVALLGLLFVVGRKKE